MASMVGRSVQEMSKNGDEPPKEYMVKENRFGSSIDTSPPLAPIPVIDITYFSKASSPSKEEEENEFDKLRSALTSWGCFKAIGHGMPISFLNEVRVVAKHFFQLPIEEKMKHSRAIGDDGAEGYENDSIVSEKQVLDWCDRLSLRVYPLDQRNYKLWPQNPKDFRDTMDVYSMNIRSITSLLFEAMAKSLKLEGDSFSQQFGEEGTIIQARLILYSPCPKPEQVLGLKPHSDRSGLTLLLQDREVGGLQILKDNQWFGVPIIPHALFVNLGDQMEIMINGIFKSPIHRVVTNRGKEKISVAIFNEPGPDKAIEPVEGLITHAWPRLYNKVKNYAAINFECFQKGIVALDTVKL